MEESLTDYNLAQNVALILLSAVLPLIATGNKLLFSYHEDSRLF